MNGIAFRRTGAPTPSSREIRSYQLRLSIPLRKKGTTLPGRFQGSPYPEARSTFGFGVSPKHHLIRIDAIRSWACRSRGFRRHEVSHNYTSTTRSHAGRRRTVFSQSSFPWLVPPLGRDVAARRQADVVLGRRRHRLLTSAQTRPSGGFIGWPSHPQWRSVW